MFIELTCDLRDLLFTPILTVDSFCALNRKNQGFVNSFYDMICISQHTKFRYFSNRRVEKIQVSLHKPAVMLEPLLCIYTKYGS